MADKSNAIADLMAKGDGVLTKRGSVWSYPGCPNDLSGTNLVLPVEYVSDIEVKAALADGSLKAAVMMPNGIVSSVRAIDDETPAVSAGLAGSAEMGTELLPGQRVEQDAGAKPVDVDKAQKQLADAMDATRPKVVAVPVPASDKNGKK